MIALSGDEEMETSGSRGENVSNLEGKGAAGGDRIADKNKPPYNNQRT